VRSRATETPVPSAQSRPMTQGRLRGLDVMTTGSLGPLGDEPGAGSYNKP